VCFVGVDPLPPPAHAQIAQQNAGWLDVVNIDADDGQAWALELRRREREGGGRG